MNGFAQAVLHARIHRIGAGCCCPGDGVQAPCCPTHKTEYADQLAEAKRLLGAACSWYVTEQAELAPPRWVREANAFMEAPR